MRPLSFKSEIFFSPKPTSTHTTTKVGDLKVGSRVILKGVNSFNFIAPPHIYTIEAIKRRCGFSLIVFTSMHAIVVPNFLYIKTPNPIDEYLLHTDEPETSELYGYSN